MYRFLVLSQRQATKMAAGSARVLLPSHAYGMEHGRPITLASIAVIAFDGWRRPLWSGSLGAVMTSDWRGHRCRVSGVDPLPLSVVKKTLLGHAVARCLLPL